MSRVSWADLQDAETENARDERSPRPWHLQLPNLENGDSQEHKVSQSIGNGSGDIIFLAADAFRWNGFIPLTCHGLTNHVRYKS